MELPVSMVKRTRLIVMLVLSAQQMKIFSRITAAAIIKIQKRSNLSGYLLSLSSLSFLFSSLRFSSILFLQSISFSHFEFSGVREGRTRRTRICISILFMPSLSLVAGQKQVSLEAAVASTYFGAKRKSFDKNNRVPLE